MRWLLLLPALVFADPWGKDADLVRPCRPTPPKYGNAIIEAGISFHQNVISPCSGPRSHFRPSSSQYMLDAVRRYGFFIGVPMGMDRLMRENNEEWVYRTTTYDGSPYKYDPVE